MLERLLEQQDTIRQRAQRFPLTRRRLLGIERQCVDVCRALKFYMREEVCAPSQIVDVLNDFAFCITAGTTVEGTKLALQDRRSKLVLDQFDRNDPLKAIRFTRSTPYLEMYVTWVEGLHDLMGDEIDARRSAMQSSDYVARERINIDFRKNCGSRLSVFLTGHPDSMFFLCMFEPDTLPLLAAHHVLEKL